MSKIPEVIQATMSKIREMVDANTVMLSSLEAALRACAALATVSTTLPLYSTVVPSV